jgi:acetyl esterase/lipase
MDASESGHSPSWRIAKRELSAPAGASDTMRNAIASTPQPDPSTMQIKPTSDEEWAAVVERMDEGKVEGVHALAEQLSVSMEADTVAGVGVFHVHPQEVDPRHRDHLFVYVHGGAFVLNGGEAGLAEPIIIARRVGMPVVSVDYRMPPGDPTPSGRDDVVAVWRELLGQRAAGSMTLGGTSGGGNISVATVQRLIELGVETPGALYLGTPAVDITGIGDSWRTNEGIDRLLVTYDGFVEAASRLYAGRLPLDDPLVSPLYGKFDGFPPTLLVTGTRDLLLSDTARAHVKLRREGVDAALLVYEGTSHVDYIAVMDSPESQHAYAELGEFILRHL